MDSKGRNGKETQAPKVVAIGGGTGLSTLLRGLKAHTPHITAIVTVADDGGSSGRLRRQLGLLPPGDFRNCIAALADDEALITQLFQFRFGQGEGLDGHSFGNLFITALAAVTGSFERAILEASRVLAVQGRILPSTLEDVTLVADLIVEEEAAPSRLARVHGESAIPRAGQPIERVFLRPEGVRAYPGAVRAILEADLIVAGPGSLFTSVLPNLLVQDIQRAVEAASCPKVYVCNVATQPGETDGYDLAQHVRALQRHVGPDLFPFVLANNNLTPALKQPQLQHVALNELSGSRYAVIATDLVDLDTPWRHDSKKLAEQLLHFYHGQRGAPQGKAVHQHDEQPITNTETVPLDIL
ncbi:MAG TPA: gluconeogenesis factor YvcK family protein [Anaerolineae bacterium]|nr:gluconeogenesis factor YvcK family protein [Anaerolineae bacterium]